MTAASDFGPKGAAGGGTSRNRLMDRTVGGSAAAVVDRETGR